MKLEHSLTLYTKNKLKMDKRAKYKPETIKLLEQNMGGTLFDINCNNIFWLYLLKQRK